MGIATDIPALNRSVLYTIGNGLLFNVTWLVIVVTASPVIAPLAAALHLAVHFALMGKGIPELKVVAQVSVLGIIIDQLLFYLGVFTVAGAPALPPVWLSCLWPVLATTLMHAFSGLQGRYALAAVFGAVGGAASFVAGTRLTSVAFASAVYGPVIIAAVWAVLFPLLLQIPRLNKVG